MIESFIVYTFLLLAMVSLSRVYASVPLNKHYGINEITFWIIILLFSLFMGMRYNVGVDYPAYLNMYYNAANGVLPNVEILFSYFTYFLAQLSIHYSVYFGLLAGAQVVFLYLTFKDEDVKILPYLSFILIAGSYFLGWMNVIRQNLVLCIFIYTIPTFLLKRRLAIYICVVVLLSLVHKSALILIVFYPLLYRRQDYTFNIYLQLLIFSIAFVFGRIGIVNNMLEYGFNFFSRILGYSSYEYIKALDQTVAVNTGLGALVLYTIDIIIIVFSNKLKAYFRDTNFLIFYQLYFWGRVFQIIVGPNIIFARPFLYMYSFKMIVSSYFLRYTWEQFKRNFNGIFFIGVSFMYILLFLASIMRGEMSKNAYSFFWQVSKGMLG
jgi:hypothetical protein